VHLILLKIGQYPLMRPMVVNMDNAEQLDKPLSPPCLDPF
jgi:hypothetical protein